MAYNPDAGLVEKAWKSASVNQTSSLPDRSATASEVDGEEIQSLTQSTAFGDGTRFLGCREDGMSVKISLSENGKEKSITISAEGDHSYKNSH